MPAYKDNRQGTWYASFYFENWQGVKQKKLKRGFATKKDALAWEREFLLQQAADLTMTFEAFVEIYITDKKKRLRENTWSTKEHIIRTKILPYFKEKRLSEIKPRDVIAWQNEMLNHHDENGKPYSPVYLKTLHNQLSAVFNHAVRHYGLKVNPAAQVGNMGKAKGREMQFWTKAEYLKFELMKAKTFKVAAKRADKRYPFNSMQIGAFMGEYLLQRFKNLSVDLHNPDIIVYVEVREGHLYIHSTPEKGAGGLPVGSSGHGLLMLSGGIDSPVAGYKMAKRGMRISAIHFESPPYTSERARIKVEKLAEKLSAYASDIKLYVVEFTEIQEKIRDICRDDLFTVIMRRVMLRIANKVAAECCAGVVITGESLGQVASQTMNAIICTDSVSEIPVFRPLIGDDKQEIIDVSYRIDTYDISIEPYEDCCTVFTPRHPKTSPKKEEVEFEESKLDIDNLLTDISINVKTIYPVRK